MFIKQPPKHYQKASMSEMWATDEEKKTIMEWLKRADNFLVFLGNPGAGKTYLAYALINHFINHGEKHIEYLNITSYGLRFYTPDYSLTRARREADYLKKHSFLILDDIDLCPAVDLANETLNEIINYRLENKLPTLITSILSKEKLLKKDEFIYGNVFHERNTILERWCEDRRQKREPLILFDEDSDEPTA